MWKSMPFYRPKELKNHTLWATHTYIAHNYKGVPPELLWTPDGWKSIESTFWAKKSHYFNCLPAPRPILKLRNFFRIKKDLKNITPSVTPLPALYIFQSFSLLYPHPTPTESSFFILERNPSFLLLFPLPLVFSRFSQGAWADLFPCGGKITKYKNTKKQKNTSFECFVTDNEKDVVVVSGFFSRHFIPFP